MGGGEGNLHLTSGREVDGKDGYPAVRHNDGNGDVTLAPLSHTNQKMCCLPNGAPIHPAFLKWLGGGDMQNASIDNNITHI